MRIIFWGKGERGASCLKALYENGFKIELVIVHPKQETTKCALIVELAKRFGIETIEPVNPNDKKTQQRLMNVEPDLSVIAGYGKILKQHIIDIPKIMCINLHGGKLPEYRGSSPMNWALINGEIFFTLSIIKVDAGIDTGNILSERTFKIAIDDTIRDLHTIANREFPTMLLEVISQIKQQAYTLRPQDDSKGSYYPLRFPDDGLILWDMYTAVQIHNRIRALTEPYPCAFTFFNKKRVKLLLSELCHDNYFGEPGRIYKKSNGRLLICALDRCLWIKEAVFADSGESLHRVVNTYDRLSTLRWSIDDYKFA